MSSIRVAICLVALGLCGCLKTPANKQVFEDPANQKQATLKVSGPLQVIVIDDPAFSAEVLREWRAQSDYDVQFHDESSTLLGQIRSGEAVPKADILIFPSPWFGHFAEGRLLRSLPPELASTNSEVGSDGYHAADVFSTIRRKETQWDQRQLAVSLGSPTPMLMVRSDLVPSVPQTWSELRTTCDELEETLPEGVVPFAQPLGEGWAARIFLSRSATYLYRPSRISSFFDFSNMQPRITSPECVRALREMKQDFSSLDIGLTPAAAFSRFASGDVAMAITWPHRGSASATEPLPFPVEVSELPGTSELFDERSSEWQRLDSANSIQRATVLGHEGRLAVIPRTSKNAGLAAIFLRWLGSSAPSSQLCPLSRSSAPFRTTHISTSGNWCDERLAPSTVAQYGLSIEAALTRAESIMSIRIPGQEQYLQTLDHFVIRALQGELEPKQALEKTSEAWESITNALGRDGQITAYRHSLGIPD